MQPVRDRDGLFETWCFNRTRESLRHQTADPIFFWTRYGKVWFVQSGYFQSRLHPICLWTFESSNLPLCVWNSFKCIFNRNPKVTTCANRSVCVRISFTMTFNQLGKSRFVWTGIGLSGIPPIWLWSGLGKSRFVWTGIRLSGIPPIWLWTGLGKSRFQRTGLGKSRFLRTGICLSGIPPVWLLTGFETSRFVQTGSLPSGLTTVWNQSGK